jgi:hypothetical protein
MVTHFSGIVGDFYWHFPACLLSQETVFLSAARHIFVFNRKGVPRAASHNFNNFTAQESAQRFLFRDVFVFCN